VLRIIDTADTHVVAGGVIAGCALVGDHAHTGSLNAVGSDIAVELVRAGLFDVAMVTILKSPFSVSNPNHAVSIAIGRPEATNDASLATEAKRRMA
jgi:hypothetical protein